MNLFNIKFRKNLPNPFMTDIYGDLIKYEFHDYYMHDLMGISPVDRHLTLLFESNSEVLGIVQIEMVFQAFNPKYPINDKFFELIENSIKIFGLGADDCLTIKLLEDKYKLSSVTYQGIV